MAAEIAIRITGVNDADNALKGATRGVKDFDDAAKKAGGGIDAFREMSVGALRAVGEAAIGMAAQGAQALGGFLKDSVDAAGTFEESINGLQAVAGSSLEAAGFSFDDVSAKALQLGKDTQFSAQQSIAAMTELVKGGVPVADVMGAATDATLALAAAGGVELTSAAEIVAKSLGVWGAAGATAASVTDAIAAAANASTLDVEGFAGAMFNAQGRAAAMNMSFEDFATSIAMISPGFKSGETAGTSYNNFLSTLIPKTDKATQAMMELGLITEDGANAFFDSTGAFVGNREAAQLLQDAFKDLNTERALEYKNIIFGNDAMGAANMYIQEGAAGYDEMTAAMASAGGAAEVAATMQQGYGFAMDQFGGSVETLQIILGTKLLPALTGVVSMFTGLVNIVMPFAEGDMFGGLTSFGIWLSEHVNPALGNFITNLAIATNPINAFLVALEQTFPALGWFIDAGRQIVEMLPVFAQGAQTAATQVMALAMQAVALGQAFITWVTPYAQQLATVFLTQVIPAAVMLWQYFVTNIIPILQNLGTIALFLIEGALTIFAAFWTTVLVPALQTVWSFLTTYIIPILAELTTWLAQNLPVAVQMATDFFTSTLLPAFTALSDFLNATLIPLVRALAEVALAIVVREATKLAHYWTMYLLPALQAVGSFIQGTLGPIFQAGLIVWFQNAKSGVDSFTRGVQAVIGWLEQMAAAINSLELPSWLTPGSPTPLEIGLKGINAQLQLTVPSFAALGAVTQGMSGKKDGDRSTTITNFNYAPTYSATPASPSADFAIMRALVRV